jgi:flagellar motility protein MotE (MotC chaperone)
MKRILSHVRLLPAVILVGMALLGLKSEALVRTAWAQEQQSPASADAAILAKDTAPLARDVAVADAGASSTPAEADVLTSLAKRRQTLDAREADLNMRAQVLAAAEARIDGKIATLKQLQDQMNALLQQRDAEEKQQLASLVKTYSAMKPKDAARIFNNLSDDVLVPVAQAMKADVLAPVLAAMNPDAAQKLTVKLAGRLKLPDTAAPATPAAATAPTAAPPGPQVAAVPAPQAAAPATTKR